MSLRSGTELVILTVVVNKVSGIYGLMALLTGYSLSYLQLAMYIYSIVALVATVFLAQRMKRSSSSGASNYTYSHLSQSSTSSSRPGAFPGAASSSSSSNSPFAALAFAYLYLIDSIINASFTAIFSLAYFTVLASDSDSSLGGTPGAIDETSGFTNPETTTGETPVLNDGSGTHGGGAPGSLSDALVLPGSFMSLGIVSALWIVRAYFVLIVLAYARQVLRSYIASTNTDYSVSAPVSTPESKSDLAENPFAEHRDEGKGWQGKLGRLMVSTYPKYWLGAEPRMDEESWRKGLGHRFSGRQSTTPGPMEVGVLERERRRRSGTGPPQPVGVELPRFVGSG
jgi:inositol phosphorylceramide synthase regulatory subunit